MISDQWYSVKGHKDSEKIHLMSGDCFHMIEAMARSMYRQPIIVKLTWMRMKVLTGCFIPCDKMLTDYCCGEIMLARKNKYDVIIKVL